MGSVPGCAPRGGGKSLRPAGQKGGPGWHCNPNFLAGEGYTFPKSRRLLKASDYDYVFSDARASSDAYFTILMRPNNKGYARLGLAISKKKIKLAVERNRLKRYIRESFRLHQHELPAMDIVAMAKPAAAGAERKELWESLAKHWRRLTAAYPSV